MILSVGISDSWCRDMERTRAESKLHLKPKTDSAKSTLLVTKIKAAKTESQVISQLLTQFISLWPQNVYLLSTAATMTQSSYLKKSVSFCRVDNAPKTVYKKLSGPNCISNINYTENVTEIKNTKYILKKCNTK